MVEKIRLVLMIGSQTIFHKTENQTNLQRTEDQINFLEMVTINFNLDPKKVLKLKFKSSNYGKKSSSYIGDNAKGDHRDQ